VKYGRIKWLAVWLEWVRQEINTEFWRGNFCKAEREVGI
jgi:hypothetical protein